jgi:hypothetical protein
MLGDIARQILIVANGRTALAVPNAREIDRLTEHFARDSAMLSHLYASAMEGYFTERLELRHSIDPVLSPMMQELIASDQPATAELAMAAMAAQSRFMQSQRRMEYRVTELPAELFHLVLRRSVAYLSDVGADGSTSAVEAMKRSYDESATRVGLMGRMVARLGGGLRAAIAVDHAGFALFSSALAQIVRQPRELAVLACHERQGARLAFCLRSAGLEKPEIERQFVLLEPAERLPGDIGDITPVRAQAILGHSTARGVS